MAGREGLGEFEQLVLLAVLRLGEEAYAPEVARDLEDSIGRSVTRGALYSTLNRLESKGLLEWQAEDPGERRRGHIRRRFEVTSDGFLAVRERRRNLLTLWDGIDWDLAESSAPGADR